MHIVLNCQVLKLRIQIHNSRVTKSYNTETSDKQSIQCNTMILLVLKRYKQILLFFLNFEIDYISRLMVSFCFRLHTYYGSGCVFLHLIRSTN